MISRRGCLVSLGTGAVGGALALPATALAAPERAALKVFARRKQITLPAVPTPGLTYIATFDLTDSAGAAVGDAAAATSIVDVTTAGPVILSQVILRLADGELHYQRMMNRFGNYPRTAVGAILGGSGAYAGARGDVRISWPDADVIAIEANVI
jgi:hypothetical protein